MAKSYTIAELNSIAQSKGWTQEETSATIDDLRSQGRIVEQQKEQDRGPLLDRVMGSIYPRTKEAYENKDRSKMDMLFSALKDASSLPGRAISAIPSSIEGENFLEELSKISTPNRSGISGNALSIIENTIKDPATIPSLAVGGPASKAITKIGGALSKPAISAASRGFAEGITSAGIHAAGPEQTTTGEKIGEIALSTGVPLLGSAISGLKKGASKKGIELIENIQETGGIEPGAFRLATTKEGRSKLSDAYGKHFKYAQGILEDLKNFDEFVPEAKQVREIIPQLPEQDVMPILIHMNKYMKAKPVGEAKIANDKIESLMNDIIDNNPTGKISAPDLYELRKQLDEIAQDAFTTQSPSRYAKAAREGRSIIKNMLIDASKESKPEYKELMSSWADKLQKKERIESFIGDDLVKQPERIDAFVQSVFRGKGKPYREDILKDLQDVFGKDYLSDIKMADYAGQIGSPSGRLPFRPPIKTGYSAMDVISFPFKSPRIAGEKTLPLLEKTSLLPQFQGGVKSSSAMQSLRSNVFSPDDEYMKELEKIKVNR